MQSPYLHIVDTSKPCGEAEGFPSDPAKVYAYPLDNFQRWAIAAISRHENVLVTAKTGSGKTLVGEYQIAESLRAGRRVFYTTPIKSLSNQKFHDLRHAFPEARVGIMTGDIKFMPDADIVIMTTEILRNLLYKAGTTTANIGLTASLSLDRLDAVIFDECHYINNRERGKVWEETMIMLPPTTSLILLSATINRPELFARWVADIRHQHMWLIPTSHRVVPLTHYVLWDDRLEPIMDARETFHDKVYRDWLAHRKGRAEAAKEFRARAAAKDTPGGLEGKVRVAAFEHTLNQTVQLLASKELLPALFFVFNRRECELYAGKLEGALIDSSDSAAVRHIIDYHLRNHKESLQNVKQYWQLRELCLRGIAYHHSGLLPVLKEMVEILFSKGHIRALFCTETFAVGINMPTKTAVFLDLKKYCDEALGLRVLHTDEYLQMAGRAGRRGLDTVGTVLYLPSREPIEVEEMRRMMKSGMPQVNSRMEFGYEFILKAFHGGTARWKSILEQSYWYQQQRSIETQVQADRAAVQARINALPLTAAQITELAVRCTLEAAVKSSTNAARKEAQRALDHWKNRHMGPVWENAFTAMATYNKLVGERSALDIQLDEMAAVRENPRLLLERRLGFLESRRFIRREAGAAACGEAATAEIALTARGEAATEINEGHPLLLVEAYDSGIFAPLTAHELVSTLGFFLADKEPRDDDPRLADIVVRPAVKLACEWLESMADEYRDEEAAAGLLSARHYWSFSPLWVEVAERWLNGEAAATICADFGLYEGNFIRGILKLSNIVEEMTALATMRNDVGLLEKLRVVSGDLVRDIVVPDSLYLRL